MLALNKFSASQHLSIGFAILFALLLAADRLEHYNLHSLVRANRVTVPAFIQTYAPSPSAASA